jgi:hypothetical protein
MAEHNGGKKILERIRKMERENRGMLAEEKKRCYVCARKLRSDRVNVVHIDPTTTAAYLQIAETVPTLAPLWFAFTNLNHTG